MSVKIKDMYFGMSQRIARWKLDNPFENWLSYKADKSILWKNIYVWYYRIFDDKYYKDGLYIINGIIESHKTEWENYKTKYVVNDMVYCLHRFGISFQDYCIYDFINKNNSYRESFVSDKLRYYYCDILNDKNIKPLMEDKYACYLKYKKYFLRDVLGCFSDKDYSTFKEFVIKHPEFIYKPLNEHSGHGVAKYNFNEISVFDFFSEKLKSGAFVVEELIIQGAETSVVHPQSVNSFRVVTFTINNTVHILGVTWRIGVKNAVLDNAGSGGIYASIDFQNGIVETEAINYKGEHFNVHPDTGVQILGYKLPEWDNFLSLVNDVATYVQGTTLISWDIAYSNKGWLMVEANDNGTWAIVQSCKKIGKKKELYKHMDTYFKLKKISPIH